MKPEPSRKKHVIVIGAGFGGMACAFRLAKLSNVGVTLVDKRNHHLFQPLLYQVATSTLTAPDIARSVRSIFKTHQNVDVRFDEAKKIHRHDKRVEFSSGHSLEYDYLVLATGVRTSFFGKNHWQKHTLQLKSLSEAFEIRKSVLKNLELADQSAHEEERKKLSTVVIVGGGPTGVELAGAFSDLIKRTMRNSFRNFDARTQRIVLLEGMPDLLTPFRKEQRLYAKRHLEGLGVEVKTNSFVEDIQPEEVHLQGGEVIRSGAIIWAAGVEGMSIAKRLDVPVSRTNKVLVNPDFTVPGSPEFYVIGDAAEINQEDGSSVPGVAPAAVQGGKFVANHIRKSILGHPIPKKFTYVDKGKMAVIGKGAAVADIKGRRIEGWFGWLIWLFIHLIFLVDFRSKLAVLINWFWSYVQDSPGSRVFTSASSEVLVAKEAPSERDHEPS